MFEQKVEVAMTSLGIENDRLHPAVQRLALELVARLGGEDLGAAGERQVGCLVWALSLLLLGWWLAPCVCTLVVVVCLVCERGEGTQL